MSSVQVYSDLLPVLIQCFAIILLGYLSGRLKFIASTEANGLKVFVTYFALPAVAFKSLATLKLGDVNWKFLACIILAKTVVFTAAVILTLLLSRRSYANAGLYAIASSQSNDFALGYPIISDVYSKTHPSFSHYLYLVAPVQLVLLNPIGFALIEYGTRGNTSPPLLRKLISSLVAIVKNPVVFMPIIAIIWNVSTNGGPIPSICLKVIDTLSEAFSACALFLLGLNMVGQLGSMEKYAALTPVLIISAKILACPLLLRHFVHVLNVGSTQNETQDLASLGFLYGMLPTAPSVFIFASQYGLPTAAVSTSMVAGTLLSAPFIFISATVAQLSKLEDLSSTMRTTVVYTGVVSAVCSLWVLFVLRRKISRVTHGTTFCLVLSQLILAVGGILWMTVPQGTTSVLQSVVALSGTFASRIWTAVLSILLSILHWRSLCFVLRIRWLIILGGFFLSASITAVLTLSVTPAGTVDPNFHYGDVQANVAAAVLAVALVITVIGMIVQRRFHIQTHGYVPLASSDECTGNCQTCNHSSSDEQQCVVPDVEDLLAYEQSSAVPSTSQVCGPQFHCSKDQTSECLTAVEDYNHQLNSQGIDQEDPHQIFRHLVLLILLCASMVVGLAVSLWRPLTDAPTGILMELEFMDILLNYGQGILAFMVFGLDTKYILGLLIAALRAITRRDPTHSALTKQTCNQFLRYHYRQCVAEIASPSTGINGMSFRGSDLVDWLLNVGLCQDRIQGERYGEQLLEGKVIRHIASRQHFVDGRYIYIFQTCLLREA
ncbi:lysosomal cholesterol signaling protein-like [Ornithodoros turicata]|uniref:lysosomal cholesterol signaling protein-like n=1 Tax=Ornithodoros turicata TaxID=34597 RepID=UPI0031399CDA